ncbi:hypothetical protein ACLJJ6_01115 [Pediococcus siamensis]|uniref:hypothetical protein n=1 Tax=Pediococcus siamensis TaxID=381829 RepID=UPI0039A09505
MEKLTGHITSKLKVLNLTPLIRFELTRDSGQKVNCLLHQHALNFLALADRGTKISCQGHLNARQQFVITKFLVYAPVQTAKQVWDHN